MHTNAGMVTALQQAVAHLSSALEMLPNTHVNMWIYTCITSDAQIRAWVWFKKNSLTEALVSQRKIGPISSLLLIDQKPNRSARLSGMFQQSEISKSPLTQVCLTKHVNTFYGLMSIPSPLRYTFCVCLFKDRLQHWKGDLTSSDARGANVRAALCLQNRGE